MNFGSKLCPLEHAQHFSIIWPSDPTCPSFSLDLDEFIKVNILTKFNELWSKLCPYSVHNDFYKICPSNLVFDPTWPIFELNLDLTRINILTKFQEFWIKIVHSRVYTRFSKTWTSDLVFDPTWPSFNPDQDFMRINILTKFHEIWIKTVPSIRVQKVFLSFELAT